MNQETKDELLNAIQEEIYKLKDIIDELEYLSDLDPENKSFVEGYILNNLKALTSSSYGYYDPSIDDWIEKINKK